MADCMKHNSHCPQSHYILMISHMTDQCFFMYVQDELKVMEEVKAKQEKEVDRDEKKVEESESACVSLKSP